MVKKLFKFIAPIIIALPIVLYIALVITNDGIARRIEKDLSKFIPPTNTVLVDSISIAGKLTGNGNGMQYMGSILVTSDLSKEELFEYYSQHFDDIEVREQETEVLDFINTRNYSFKLFSDPNATYYSITCWDANRGGQFNDFITQLLDLDIRGH